MTILTKPGWRKEVSCGMHGSYWPQFFKRTWSFMKSQTCRSGVGFSDGILIHVYHAHQSFPYQCILFPSSYLNTTLDFPRWSSCNGSRNPGYALSQEVLLYLAFSPLPSTIVLLLRSLLIGQIYCWSMHFTASLLIHFDCSVQLHLSIVLPHCSSRLNW